MADKPLTKKDLESITQKVTVANQQTVVIENASDIAKPIVEEQKKNDIKKLEADIKNRALFEDISIGMEMMADSLKEGLGGIAESFKGKAGKGLFNLGKILGVAAGVILAPVITAGAFFKQVGLELKFLDKILGGKLSKTFKPAINFFRRVKIFFSRKGPFGSIIKAFKNISSLTKNLGPLASGFKQGFGMVAKFAKVAGRVLGKVFLPITILMSIFDFVKGFMKGFKEDGIIGGITEGIVSVFDGLVGGLGRILAWIPSKIAEFLGFDNLAAGFTDGMNNMIEGIKNAFRGLVDIVVGIFTFDGPKIMEGLTAVWNGITGFIGGIFEPLIGLIKDVFGADVFSKIGDALKNIGLNISAFFANIKLYIVGLLKKIPFVGEAQWIKDMEAGANEALNQIEKERKELADLQKQRAAQQVVVVGDSGSGGGTVNNNNFSPTNIVMNDNDRSTKALQASLASADF